MSRLLSSGLARLPDSVVLPACQSSPLYVQLDKQKTVLRGVQRYEDERDDPLDHKATSRRPTRAPRHPTLHRLTRRPSPKWLSRRKRIPRARLVQLRPSLQPRSSLLAQPTPSSPTRMSRRVSPRLPRRTYCDGSLTSHILVQPTLARSSSPDAKGKGRALEGGGAGDGTSDDDDKDTKKPLVPQEDPEERALLASIPKANIVGLKYARGITTRASACYSSPLSRSCGTLISHVSRAPQSRRTWTSSCAGCVDLLEEPLPRLLTLTPPTPHLSCLAARIPTT